MAEPTKTAEQRNKEAEEAKKKQEEEKKQKEERLQKEHEQRIKDNEETQKRNQEQQKQKAQQRGQEQKAAKSGAGVSSTYSGTDEKKDPRGDTFLTHDEIKELAGDIVPGELAHLELDEEGKPTGPIFREIPGPEDVTTTVIAPAQPRYDEIVTPSGAPVSKYMNPDPVLWDAGMLARNPPPEQPGDMPSGPIGGGVVNQGPMA
jgi:hypothetical protein